MGDVILLPVLPGRESDCPECRNGKHENCTGWAIDEDTDDVVECDCATGGHL